MSFLEIGAKLSLKPLNRTASGTGLELISRIESEMPDEHILIEAPIHKGELYPITLKEPLRASFVYEEGVCEFRCVAVERLTEGGLNYIKARIISDISHTQRREYFRIKTAIAGTIIVHKRSDNETQKVPVECMASDISCGGIALYIKEYCNVGEMIKVSIPIGQKDEIVHLNSEVKWCKKEEVGEYNFLIGVRFCYLDNFEKEIVRKYVHQLQQKMIQKMRNKNKPVA